MLLDQQRHQNERQQTARGDRQRGFPYFAAAAIALNFGVGRLLLARKRSGHQHGIDQIVPILLELRLRIIFLVRAPRHRPNRRISDNFHARAARSPEPAHRRRRRVFNASKSIFKRTNCDTRLRRGSG
jgi:hypothetical protein